MSSLRASHFSLAAKLLCWTALSLGATKSLLCWRCKQWFGRLGVSWALRECGPFMMELEGGVGFLNREQFPLHSPQAKCSASARLSCWHGMMMPHSLLILLFSAEIFERIGPRERRVLWDPFGAVQCGPGINVRLLASCCAPVLATPTNVCSRGRAWSLALTLPVSPCRFCFWDVALDQSNRGGRRQRGEVEGPGHRETPADRFGLSL